jgi:16S rRNA U516 pseudouridylate synthase RsuA-like enzyme
MGVCSRRYAEKLMAQGYIYVDDIKVTQNMLVNDRNKIQVKGKSGIYTPVKENTRIWLYNKPRYLVCTHQDPMRRVTIFDRLHDLGLRQSHLMSVVSLVLLCLGQTGLLVRGAHYSHKRWRPRKGLGDAKFEH